MLTDGDAAKYVVQLIMQDQPPADSQELIAKSLQDLQRMAHMVTTRVNDRIAQEQGEAPQPLQCIAWKPDTLFPNEIHWSSLMEIFFSFLCCALLHVFLPI